jgi:predicted phosphodiesterase
MDTHALLVVLNTVADHTDEETAKRGSFQGYRLELLREQLSQYSSKKYSFRIAMLHHHPLLHSHMNYSSSDVLSNGDQLVDLLAKHTFDIIVHGHKHQPRIRRHNAHGHNMIVFAAGSFSAFLHDLGSTTRNLFHILTLRSSTEDHEFVAQLQTWEYNHGCGWNPTSKRSAGLPYILKFKPKMPSINIEELKNFILKQDVPTIYAQELYEEFPLLEYVLPEELEAIGREMLIHEIKLIFDDNGMLYQIGRTFRKQ